MCCCVSALVVRNLIAKDTVAQPAAVSSLHLLLHPSLVTCGNLTTSLAVELIFPLFALPAVRRVVSLNFIVRTTGALPPCARSPVSCPACVNAHTHAADETWKKLERVWSKNLNPIRTQSCEHSQTSGRIRAPETWLNTNTMKMLALPLLITLLHSPVCLSVTVSSSKPKVEVHEHTDAVLACEFRTEKDQNPRIEWKKKGKGVTFVYFNHKFTGSYAGRAKIEGATLTIHSVTQKDSGEYRCEVTASEDHVSLGEATVTLNVLVPPHVPSCEVPNSVFVGSGLELLCKDKLSVPPATYRWFKDNKALTATADTPYSIDTNKGTLKFKSVSKTDGGMYRCESSNSVGAPKSCVAQQLKVIDYPLNLTILIAGAAGFLILILFCCICVCVCRRRGCCKKEKRTKSTKSYNPPPPPPPTRNLKHYKQTQSFMI